MATQKDKIELAVKFFYEAGTLRKIARAHRQGLLTDDLSDNIASHSFRVAVIGYTLSKFENADPGKVLLMCTFHDVGETRSGDQNSIHKKYVKVFEEEIMADQLLNGLADKELIAVMEEYQQRVSLESKVAKDADLLDQTLLQKEYAWAGNQEAQRWLDNSSLPKRMSTKTAKKMFAEICRQKPSDWWTKESTWKRR